MQKLGMKKLSSLFVLSLLTLALSSCSFIGKGLGGGLSSSSSSSSSPSSFEYGDDSFTKVDDLGYSLYDLGKNQFSYHLPSTGNVKILVVPVQFTNVSGKVGVSDSIQKAFFGESSDTSWESLASYYYKSSYGKLNITGEVTDWFTYPNTSTSFQNLTGSGQYASSYDPTWTMIDKVTTWLKNQNFDLTEYDTDKDGYIDALWMVYSKEYNTSSNVWWAYTFHDYDNDGLGDVNSPVAFNYSWASYKFLYEGYGTSGIDAHTFIHETGHLLGLDDYYSYDGNEGPAGGVDMMDYNVGDHSSYSKMLLNWASPYVFNWKESSTITLKPFESSGDFILLRPKDWNGTAFDEYILIEYYTPTGLNEVDSSGYAGGLGTYSGSGVKIWHVDSRMLYEVYSGGSWKDKGYTDTFPSEAYESYFSSGYYYDIAASNTPSYSNNSNFSLLSLIQATGTNYLSSSNYKRYFSLNANLFHEGNTFNVSSFSSFFYNKTKLNDGSSLDATVSIGELTSTGVNITITI